MDSKYQTVQGSHSKQCARVIYLNVTVKRKITTLVPQWGHTLKKKHRLKWTRSQCRPQIISPEQAISAFTQGYGQYFSQTSWPTVLEIWKNGWLSWFRTWEAQNTVSVFVKLMSKVNESWVLHQTFYPTKYFQLYLTMFSLLLVITSTICLDIRCKT